MSTLIQRATATGLDLSANIPLLSGVLADFLSELIGMSEHVQRKQGGSAELATHLENGILGGAIHLDPPLEDHPIFSYQPSGWQGDLPLMRVSSMVSELAPVVVYLRYLVHPGDVLIIEEPEAHLHPGMQTAFAREIARMVRSGIRVVLTTHSEWFLEQIGNLVRLSELPEEEREGIEGADVVLCPEEVGAWLFSSGKHHKGSVVKEIELDPETGLFPTDYDVVSETLYNESARIFNRLQEVAGE